MLPLYALAFVSCIKPVSQSTTTTTTTIFILKNKVLLLKIKKIKGGLSERHTLLNAGHPFDK